MSTFELADGSAVCICATVDGDTVEVNSSRDLKRYTARAAIGVLLVTVDEHANDDLAKKKKGGG